MLIVMKDEIKELQNIVKEMIRNGENPKEIRITFGYDIIDKIINLQKENRILKELNVCVGCKDLYRYTPEKGFKLVGDEDE